MGEPLRIVVTPPSGHSEIFLQAERDTGVKVSPVVLPTEDLLYTVQASPESFDLVQLEYWMVPQAAAQGLIQPIAARELDRYADILPLFLDGTVDGIATRLRGTPPHEVQFARPHAGNGARWLNLAPTICNCDTLGWREDLVPFPVESWAALLDPALAGRVAVADIPAVSIVELALACEARGLMRYRDLGDLARDEIDRTVDILLAAARAGQFGRPWRTYEESVESMCRGDIVVQSLWPPAAAALQARRVPVRYRPLAEGARGWAGGLALAAHLGGARRQAALAYVNWYHAGWPGAFLTRQGYYSAVPATARRHLSADEWGYWLEGRPAAGPIRDPRGTVIDGAGSVREGGSYSARMGRIACWSSAMTEAAHLRRRWQEFSALFGPVGRPNERTSPNVSSPSLSTPSQES